MDVTEKRQGREAKATRPLILLVDDEPHVVDGLALQLRRTYRIETYTDPLKARARLRQQPPPDAVVSDMRMPGLSGVELLRAAREDVPRTARVLLTGHSDFGAAVAAVNDAGVHRFLTKPCQPAVLSNALAESLEAAQRADDELGRLGKVATLGTMAGSIGHEIGNLVAALHGSLEVVREQVARGEVPEAEDVGVLELVQTRLGEHARALKDLAKPREPKLEPLALESVILGCLDVVRRAGFLRGVEVRAGDASGLPRVRGDLSALEGVFLNLFKNASEALVDRARTESEDDDSEWRATLRITFRSDAARLWVVLEDNGCGMSAETVARIGERFYTTKGAAGTGLGFAVVRAAVEAHGGELEIASEVNAYTRMAIGLPVAG